MLSDQSLCGSLKVGADSDHSDSLNRHKLSNSPAVAALGYTVASG